MKARSNGPAGSAVWGRCGPRPAGGGGFALVLALGVLAFVLVLLLLFSAWVRVELHSSNRQREQLAARQNASLALQMAVGELRKEAGPDRRVTARGRLLPSARGGAERKFWTGVWDTDASGAPVRWLVSGACAAPEGSPGGAGRIAVVGPGSAGESVEVPLVPVAGGAYGWWVGDEGVKASAGSHTRVDALRLPGFGKEAPAGSDAFWSRLRIRQTGGGIFDIEPLLAENPYGFTHRIGDRDDPEDRGLRTRRNLRTGLRLDSIVGPERGEAANPSHAAGKLTPTERRRGFHDFTWRNAFTLTNTLDGGLRSDLSSLRRMEEVTEAALDAAFEPPARELLSPGIARFLRAQADAGAGGEGLAPGVPEDYPDEPVSFAAVPLVPEIALLASFGVRSLGANQETNELYLYFFLIAELLNPHTHTLLLDNGPGAFPGDPSDVQVRITGLPPIEVENRSAGNTTSVDLENLVLAPGANSFNDHEPGYMRPVFAPTRQYRRRLPDGSRAGKGVYAVKIAELAATPETRDDFRIHVGESDVTIALRESNTHPPDQPDEWAFFLTDRPASDFPSGVPVFPEDGDPSEGPAVFQEIVLRDWGGFTLEHAGAEDQTRLVRGLVSGMNRTVLNNAQSETFGIHGKFLDEWNEASAADGAGGRNIQFLDKFFRLADPRQKRIEIDMANPFEGDGRFYDVRAPLDVDRSSIGVENDFFHGAEFGSDKNNRLARLFDHPRGPPVSPAVLNHLHFAGQPYQPLANRFGASSARGTIAGDGSAPGESWNNVFDRYFFSTLPEDSDTWAPGTPLPNQKLVFAGKPGGGESNTLASPESGGHFLVSGGFNINSTSARAWEALLNPVAVPRLVYTDTSGQRFATPDVRRVFHNHAFRGNRGIRSDGRQFDYVPPEESGRFAENLTLRGPAESYIQGFRELTEGEARQLADAIVNGIRGFAAAEGRPFYSLTEFLNEGILQAAIDAVPSINAPANEAGERRRIPDLAAAFFSPHTIMNTVGHYLFTRSDTFRIRAYGRKDAALADGVAAEALLEAEVQRLPAPAPEAGGRRFRIISVRWLNKGEW